MKKIFRTVTAVCLSAAFAFAALPQSAYAAETPAQPVPKVTVKETYYRAEYVINTESYGTLVFFETDTIPPMFTLMDSEGGIIFPYKTFPSQFILYDGLFVNGVKDTKKYSLFDLSGKQVIKESYDYLDYRNGYGLAIDYENGQYLIDKTGKKILTLPKIFNKVLFSAERASSFEWIAPVNTYYASIGGYGEGLMWFEYNAPIEKNIMELESVEPDTVPKVDPWEYETFAGYMNLDGSVAIAQDFYEVYPFNDGLALVSKLFPEDALGYRYGFIDKAGNIVIDTVYSSAHSFSGGYAAVQNSDGKWGYIDKEGNTVLPFIYDDTMGYGDGLFAAAVTAGTEINEYGYEVGILKYGMVDINGNTVVPFGYDDISQFINGTAYAVKNEVVYVLTLDTAQ